jgi:predicted enzyme related to lactoylglutathione lyase
MKKISDRYPYGGVHPEPLRSEPIAMEISYIEIGAGDARATGSFLAKLLGWTLHPMGDAGDGWFEAGAIKAGLHGGEQPPRLDLYFRVPDLRAAIERVRELGGEADEPGPEEASFGRFANCRAPDGLRFGLHQPPTL